MIPLRYKALPLFLLTVTLPVYLTGCAGANAIASSAAASSSTGSAGSGNSGSTVDNNSQSSGTGSSDSGTSTSTSTGTSTSDSGSSTSSSGSGTSDSGASTGTSTTASTSASAAATGAVAPLNALKVANMQLLSNWDGVYDAATGSSSSGSSSGGQMSLTSSPSRSGSARKFVTRYTNNGGERYWVSFASDTATTNFLYDAWIYLDDSSGSIANLEMDLNQVMSNGQTVIYGVQCDGWSGTWDYTTNDGMAEKPKGAWIHSKAPCNPRNWKKNTWHHVQIEYSRDNAGNVTYKSIWLDGAEQDLNATVPAAYALGWRLGTLLTNFQVDGLGTSGTATVYLDDLTIYRW